MGEHVNIGTLTAMFERHQSSPWQGTSSNDYPMPDTRICVLCRSPWPCDAVTLGDAWQGLLKLATEKGWGYFYDQRYDNAMLQVVQLRDENARLRAALDEVYATVEKASNIATAEFSVLRAALATVADRIDTWEDAAAPWEEIRAIGNIARAALDAAPNASEGTVAPLETKR